MCSNLKHTENKKQNRMKCNEKFSKRKRKRKKTAELNYSFTYFVVTHQSVVSQIGCWSNIFLHICHHGMYVVWNLAKSKRPHSACYTHAKRSKFNMVKIEQKNDIRVSYIEFCLLDFKPVAYPTPHYVIYIYIHTSLYLSQRISLILNPDVQHWIQNKDHI